MKNTPNKPKPAPVTDPVLTTPSAFPKYRVVPVETLVAYERNARTHTPAQISKIAASIQEFGFTNPVLTDGKKGIVAGHGRVLAALKLGMDRVPVVELSHLTAAQRRAYVIADNKLALDAGWDDELLTLELGDLKESGFDLALTGFDDGELLKLFADDGGAGDAGPIEGNVKCPSCGHEFPTIAKAFRKIVNKRPRAADVRFAVEGSGHGVRGTTVRNSVPRLSSLAKTSACWSHGGFGRSPVAARFPTVQL